jgi:hypothetical protein
MDYGNSRLGSGRSGFPGFPKLTHEPVVAALAQLVHQAREEQQPDKSSPKGQDSIGKDIGEHHAHDE